MKKNGLKKLKIHPIIFYSIAIIYLELIIKYVIAGHLFNIGLLYLFIFTLPTVILLTFLSKLGNNLINKIITIILTLIITIYFEVQYIFYILFSVPFSFATISLANQALDFTSIIKESILTHLPIFILLLVPLIILIFLTIIKKIDYSNCHKASKVTLLSMFIISYLSTYIFIIPITSETKSANNLYFNIDDQVSIINEFGLITYTKIDLKRQLLGYNVEIITEAEQPVVTEEVKEYGKNELDLDFSKETSNKNIQTINKYMQSSSSSSKTEYTGMFAGKNLIFILAEGFNEIAVDEERTPTLYKMINGGFKFNNFYSPVFLSTTGGEFQATTGLIPTQEILSIWKSQSPTISYALGNSFSKIGYNVQSYHDWTYSYYKRNVTMKTLGFNNYTGCGNGLEEKMNCSWLPYDTDMIDVTVDDYLTKDGNFVTYYVTVSGHSPYNSGDRIAKKYYDYVKDLDYSKEVKYYLAAQMELDSMLEELLTKLEETNHLDDTVIALVGDHYPYTLSTSEVNEVSSYTKDSIVEINHSNFIIWSNTIEEPIEVDKVGSQIDVLPTLLNLFGIEYDSRLILGKDILSDSEGIAIFSNRSWTTDYGTYNASTKKFTLKEGKELEDEESYIKRINTKVANYFSLSKLIIDTDYYKYILES